MPDDLETDILDITEETREEPERKPSRWLPITLIAAFIIGCLGAFSLWLYSFIQTPPAEFPVNTEFTIAFGTGTKQALAELKAAGYIRSTVALYAELRLKHPDQTIKAGTYTFTTPLSISELAIELTEGNPIDNTVRLTLIEGETARQIAARAAAVLPDFDSAEFLTLATPYEGKLFPETYLVPRTFTAEELFSLLTNTFDEKIAPLETALQASDFTVDEVVILASILEREANTGESMRTVSGILQNRLKIGMALQVDASIEYVLGKPLSELTPEDLERDTPYNTYLYPGLPPTAIGNPGLEAIEAILSPINTEYMFYITGNDGEFYYALDFDEHRRNIERYLR